jgi:hypothetical protein
MSYIKLHVKNNKNNKLLVARVNPNFIAVIGCSDEIENFNDDEIKFTTIVLQFGDCIYAKETPEEILKLIDDSTYLH